jgi:hypothetical protein
MLIAPKNIWMFWSQGWDEAPQVAQSGLASWRDSNPGWACHALTDKTAREIFGEDLPPLLIREDLPLEAYSDVLRIELLARFGGVWVDATTICARPLDDWLLEHGSARNFFAFSRPGADRMLSSWFLYAASDSLMIMRLRDAVRAYWENRQERDSYFWLHNLFAEIYEADAEFRRLWDAPPHITARQPFHFAPHAPRLDRPPSTEDIELLNSNTWPVFKLTHKRKETGQSDCSAEGSSLFDVLSAYRPPDKAR